MCENISQAVKTSLYAGWYTWSNSKGLTHETVDANYSQAMQSILNNENGDYLSRIWIAGNMETQVHFPDYLDGTPRTRLERVNQTFCIFEDLPENPTGAEDEILGAINQPEAPPGQPKNIKVKINALTSTTINWQDTYLEINYSVYRYTTDSAGAVKLATLPANATTYTDQSVTENNTYNYYIIAENSHGNNTSELVTIEITTTPPPHPTDFKITHPDCYSNQLSWQDDCTNETGYTLARQEVGNPASETIFTLNPNTNTYDDQELAIGIQYQYQLSITNHIGTTSTEWLLASDNNCLGTPNIPANLSANLLMCKEIELTWKDNAANELGYELQISVNYQPWHTVALEKNTTSYSALYNENTPVNFRIRTYNATGVTSWSEELATNTENCLCQQTTFNNSGMPWPTNTRIEAENFDICTSLPASQKITYYEPDVTNHVGDLTVRPDAEIDIFSNYEILSVTPSEHITRLGSVQPGEYYEYTIHIPQDDTYIIVARLANNEDARTMKIFMDNKLASTINYDFTGGWQYYYEFDSTPFEATSGTHVFRITSETGGTDMDYLKVIKKSATRTTPSTSSENCIIFPNPAKNRVTIDAASLKGRKTARFFNLEGSLLLEKSFIAEKHTISLKGLPKGYYQLIISDQNTAEIQKLLVK